MKTILPSNIVVALVLAVVVVVGNQSRADGETGATVLSKGTLPTGIPAGSPVAEVVKLVQAGVDVSVIQTYISNCPTAFNLDADKIIALTDAGLSDELVQAMFTHDKTYLAALATAVPAAQEPAPVTAPAVVADNAATVVSEPATPVTREYFYGDLAPYGTWVDINGYGRCWRPNVVIYDTNWRPYCDRGSWVYTDCGWYWNSEYAWGATFHYGRWFNDPRHGWCWWPDTVWAPSWVTWRSNPEYCGWAPLPPYTVYTPGVGLVYRGSHIAVGFDFGLASSCFTFVSAGSLCDSHPRYHCLPPPQVSQFYHQTTIINNFNHDDHHALINNGVSVTIIGTAAHHPIHAVPIGQIINPGHHGPIFVAPGHRWGGDAGAGRYPGREYTSPRNGGFPRPDSSRNNDNRVHGSPVGNPAQRYGGYNNHGRPGGAGNSHFDGNSRNSSVPAPASPGARLGPFQSPVTNHNHDQFSNAYLPQVNKTVWTPGKPNDFGGVRTIKPIRPPSSDRVVNNRVQPTKSYIDSSAQPRPTYSRPLIIPPAISTHPPQRASPAQNIVQSPSRPVAPAPKPKVLGPSANNGNWVEGSGGRNR